MKLSFIGLNMYALTSLEVRLGNLASRSDSDYMKIKVRFMFLFKKNETLSLIGLNLCTPTSLEVRLSSLASRSDSDYMKTKENFVLLAK